MKRTLPILAVVFAALAAMSSALAQIAPPPLPPAVHEAQPGLKPIGEGRLRVFGFHVYDGALWVLGERFDARLPYALDLRYAREFKGKDIVRRSIEEMAKQGLITAEREAKWTDAMARVFPDVQEGDRIVGLAWPGREARFYSRDNRLLGIIRDAEFVDAFFAIWLSEKTSEPALRKKLLGE